jgi:hypothetical protein
MILQKSVHLVRAGSFIPPAYRNVTRKVQATEEKSDCGVFSIKSGSQHDDLAMAFACCVVPLLAKGILEKSAPRAVPNIFIYSCRVTT